MDLRKKVKNLMLGNFRATGKKYITPAWPHYRYQWLWDSCFHAIICAKLGLKKLAKNEIEQLLKWQREDGFIPHEIYHGKKRLFDVERWTFKDRKYHSNYTQPPVMARSLQAINDPEFTKKVFKKVVKFYLYYLKKQDPNSNGLISVVHPCETGRDVDPTWDNEIPRIKTKGRHFLNNIIVSIGIMLKLNLPYRRVGWDIKKIWKMNIFNIEDVMYNSIWVDGMRTLESMTDDKKEKEMIKEAADWVEASIYQKMWDEKDKIFYALDKNGKMIKVKTVSNLFPIILPNIPKEMLDSLVEHLTNPEEFWTPYLIPSVSASEPSFNPDFSIEKLMWRGPTWINTNWYIIKGLLFQAKRFDEERYRKIAEHIMKKSIDMVKKYGIWEFYNPLTGEGYRTENLGWSGLVIDFFEYFKNRR